MQQGLCVKDNLVSPVLLVSSVSRVITREWRRGQAAQHGETAGSITRRCVGTKALINNQINRSGWCFNIEEGSLQTSLMEFCIVLCKGTRAICSKNGLIFSNQYVREEISQLAETQVT